ncbi:MAG: DUF5615 family PIN-like protein [Promethearchaeota archaeon]|jgi:uncharacterized protein with PIN domain
MPLEMKFLVDAMLGKLTRFLRILGYDTVYANDLIDYFHVNPVPDEKLVDYAKENNRFIITKDFPLFKRFYGNCIYLKGEGIQNYLDQLNKVLNIDFEFKVENARCSLCNSTLKRITDKNLVKDHVLLETYMHYDEFFQCKNLNCKKIYWEGSHIEDIKNKLDYGI